jgi:hypothetical protein
MQKKISIKACLSLLVLVTTLVFGCDSTMVASKAEGKSPVLKIEGLSSAPTGVGGVSMRVLWTVSGYKIGNNALWGEKEARTMLFKPLDITATAIIFDGKTCHDVILKNEKVKAKEYLAQTYNTTPPALGIQDEIVEVVKTNCDLPGFGEYLRLKDRRLVIDLNGVFFYFEPAVNY